MLLELPADATLADLKRASSKLALWTLLRSNTRVNLKDVGQTDLAVEVEVEAEAEVEAKVVGGAVVEEVVVYDH